MSEKAGHLEMHDPAHPGEIIREDCIHALGISITAAARGLGVLRQSLSELLNGRAGVSAEMATRLEKAGWSNASAWLRIQANDDLWQARQRESSIRVERWVNPAESAGVAGFAYA